MLSHSYLFLYSAIYYVYVHVYMLSLGMRMYMCMQSTEKDVQCLPVLLSTFFFKQIFSLNLELGIQLAGHRCASQWLPTGI